MFFLTSTLFCIVGFHHSSQNILLPKHVEANKPIQEWFFQNKLNMYPDERINGVTPSEYTKVYLFSRSTGEDYSEIIWKNLSSFNNSGFDINKPTKMLVHGWMAGALASFEDELRETYLAAQDVNVLAVDWSEVADNVVYAVARAAVTPVGEYLAEYVDWLVSEADVVLDSIHVVGHSLGAHIAGVLGEHVTVGQISRISGLDPAGPGFSNATTSGRLDSSDAQFVDVIHTCGSFAGFFDACGHVDFYPNKGKPPQPGCEAPIILSCSHVRSHHLFNESITSDGFQSVQCANWKQYAKGLCNSSTVAIMGEHVDSSVRGKFYLYTNESYPYALWNSTVV